MVNGIEIVGKSLIFLRDLNPKLYSSNYYDINVNKYKGKCGTSLKL